MTDNIIDLEQNLQDDRCDHCLYRCILIGILCVMADLALFITGFILSFPIINICLIGLLSLIPIMYLFRWYNQLSNRGKERLKCIRS